MFVIFVVRANLNLPLPEAAIVGGDESRGENRPSHLTYKGEVPNGLGRTRFPEGSQALTNNGESGYKRTGTRVSS